jgi:endo-1,4-beta-xylanase
MEILLNFLACKAYTMWGFTDAHSWIPSFSPGSGAALIFDQNYAPKPAYYLLQETLQKGPVTLNYPTDKSAATDTRHIPPPFRAMRAPKTPIIDGQIEPGEWDAGVLYQSAYNQLNPTDQRPPMDVNDLYGTWKILYDKNVIYGVVQRIDDVTVTNHKDDWENDNLEVFFDLDGTFAQLRTIVGKDWADHPLQGNRKAVWSQDGKVLEFMVALLADDVTGRTIGWNIALSDNDQGPGSSRKYQLYPIYGFNDSWQGKNLAEIAFQ